MTVQSHGKAFAVMQNERALVPDDVLCIYIKDQTYGKQVADYYMSVRSIPPANLLPIALTWKKSDASIALNEADSDLFVKEIAEFILANTHIRCLCLCGEMPQKMNTKYVSGTIQSTVAHAASRAIFYNTYVSSRIFDAQEGDTSYTTIPSQLREMMKPYLADEYNPSYRIVSSRGNLLSAWVLDLWESSREYSIGDSVATTTLRYIDTSVSPATEYNTRSLVCTTAGVSGSVEPTDLSGTGITDGGVVWDIEQKVYPVYQSEKYRMSKTYYEDMGKVLSNFPYWETALAYPVCVLDAPYISPLDPNNTSRLDVVKRMIDDALYVESQNLTSFPGDIFLAKSDTVPIGATRITLEDHGYSDTDYYHDDFSSENGTHGTYTFAASTNYPTGSTTLFPQNPTSSYPVQDNVFIHYFGEKEYFSNTTRPPVPTALFSYARGGIEISSQSYGFVPSVLDAADMFYDDYTLSPDQNAAGAWQSMTTGSNYNIKYLGAEGIFQVNGMRIVYSGTGVGRFRVPSNNTIELEEDGTVILTINLTTGTLFSHYEYMRQLSIPTGWAITLSGKTAESRGARALRSGAAVAIGTAIEPNQGGASQGALMIGGFLSGACLAEATLCMSANEMNGGGTLTMAQIYGDPLYRPLHAINRLL